MLCVFVYVKQSKMVRVAVVWRRCVALVLGAPALLCAEDREQFCVLLAGENLP